MIALREATLEDAPVLALLHTESWRSAYANVLPSSYLEGAIEVERTAVWRQRMSDSHTRQFAVLAEQGGEAVGFVYVIFDEEPQYGAMLDNLHIRPQLKRQGLGQRLMGEAARRVRAVEPSWPMHLWVFSENEPAQKFYDALGGEIVETKPKPTPAGTMVDSVCYIWKDLTGLARL